ncbi:MAG: hypothetical protein EBU84_00355 [Actinobacteria bacterium]|nr:hypothetical protein [Actinomycetota bacterium]
MNDSNFKDMGINVALFLAGLAGAILSISRTSAITWRETLLALFGGAVAANYLTPLIVELAHITSQSLTYAVAFLTGHLGLRIVEKFSSKLMQKLSGPGE